MSSIIAQQTKLNLKLVTKEKRLEIGKSNGRINLEKTQIEPTFQVVLDALALILCYSAFLTTMFICTNSRILSTSMTFPTSLEWTKRRNFTSIWKVSKISFRFAIEYLRTFATIINRSQSRKTTGLDKLHLSRAQILWQMYYKKNVDYVELLREDFTYRIDNRGHKKQEKMYYPRFTKVIIHYFLTKDKTVSRRNKIGVHTSRDDYLINTLRFVSIKEESQIYQARLRESMTSHEMRETKAYKTYIGYATGGRDEDDNNNVHDSSSEGSDQESDSGDDNTQSNNEKGSDFEHEIDENEMGFESDQEENEEKVKDDEEEKEDEYVKTLSNYTSTDDEDETNVESKVKNKAVGDFFLDNDITGVYLMTTPVVGALADFFTGLLTLFDFHVGSSGETETVVSLGEADFLNFPAFFGGVTPVA
nr:hypothetical protein [Tanacetum cinerariifolium]